MLFLDTPPTGGSAPRPRAARRRWRRCSLAAPAAGAATRQVAPGGSDSGNCLASACRSLGYAYGQSAQRRRGPRGSGRLPVADGARRHEGGDLQGCRRAPKLRQLDNGASNVVFDGLEVDGAFTKAAGLPQQTATTSTFRNGRIGNVTDEKGALVSGTNFTFDNVVFHDVRVTDPSVHNECVYAIVVPGITVRNSLFHDCATMDLFFTYGSWWTPLPPAYGRRHAGEQRLRPHLQGRRHLALLQRLRGQHRERRRHARRLGGPQQHLRDRRPPSSMPPPAARAGSATSAAGSACPACATATTSARSAAAATRPWRPRPRRRRVIAPLGWIDAGRHSTSACRAGSPAIDAADPNDHPATRPRRLRARRPARRRGARVRRRPAQARRRTAEAAATRRRASRASAGLVRSAQLRPRVICKHRRRSCARSARLQPVASRRARACSSGWRACAAVTSRAACAPSSSALRKRPALRIRARGLPRGRYRVVVVATSAAGVKSSARKSFTPARSLSQPAPPARSPA